MNLIEFRLKRNYSTKLPDTIVGVLTSAIKKGRSPGKRFPIKPPLPASRETPDNPEVNYPVRACAS